MAILNKAWNNFKIRPDVWFFYGFLLTFTLSIRKVLFFFPIRGNFNEYTGIYLYLSDILLVLTILVWLYTILQNKTYNLSSCIQFFSRQEIFVLPLVLAIWAFISISWAGNTNLALFRSLKLTEFSLLFFYLVYNVPCLPRSMFHGEHSFRGGTIMRNIIRLVIVLGFIQAIIGISQAIVQHSVGLFWLKESLILINIDGVAKVVLFGHKFIRVYGLFPHPNILGGFLLVSIMLTFTYRKMFHVKHSCHSERSETKSKNLIIAMFYQLDPSTALGMTLFLVVQIIALLLTFSRSAIIGLFIAISYIFLKFVRLKGSQLFHVKQFNRYLIIILIIFALFIVILGFNTNSLLFKSLNERLLYLNVSCGTIINNPIVGIGMGQFVAEMQKYSSVFLADWQYQPVHNVFLMIWSELGIIGLVLFILFLWKVFHANGMFHSRKNVPPQKECSTGNILRGKYGTFYGASMEQNYNNALFKSILLGFIFIMLFDHYLWDIQQGQIILWMILGLVAAGAND